MPHLSVKGGRGSVSLYLERRVKRNLSWLFFFLSWLRDEEIGEAQRRGKGEEGEEA